MFHEVEIARSVSIDNRMLDNRKRVVFDKSGLFKLKLKLELLLISVRRNGMIINPV